MKKPIINTVRIDSKCNCEGMRPYHRETKGRVCDVCNKLIAISEAYILKKYKDKKKDVLLKKSTRFHI